MNALEVSNLTVAYTKIPVIWNINVSFPSSQIIGIVGPNGSGKSTFLKSLIGLIPKTSGEILFFGQVLSNSRDKIAYLPQRESVDWDFPISALDVVLMGCYGRIGIGSRINQKEIQFAKECLDRVNMLSFANRQISQLSGGQQQRVFLARALAQNPSIYFLDEPFAAVDAGTESAIMDIIRKLKSEGKTIIIVHHDLHSVIEYMDHVMLLNTRLVSFGKTTSTMTIENLKATYGGKLQILDQIVAEVAKRNS